MECLIAHLLCVISVLFHTGMPFQSSGKAKLHFDVFVSGAISAATLISSGNLSLGELLNARCWSQKATCYLGKYGMGC